MENTSHTGNKHVLQSKRAVVFWEKDFLEKYKSAMDKAYSNDKTNIKFVIAELRIAIESLLKAICTILYGADETKDIRDVHIFLDKQGFWGKGAGNDFNFHSDRLSVINKKIRIINSIGNYTKHKRYNPTYIESVMCMICMHGIIEWYFKELFNFQHIEFNEAERSLLDKTFSNLHFPKEFELLLREKDQQINELVKQKSDMISAISKRGTKISSLTQTNKYLLAKEIEELKKIIEKFPIDTLYCYCGFLLFNLAIIDDLNEKKLDEARKMLIHCIRLNRYNYEAFNYLGNVLAKEAEKMDSEELYMQSIEKYKAAIKINHSYFYAHYNCGLAYQKLCAYRNEQEKNDVLEKALSFYSDGEKYAELEFKNYAAYNIACIYSQLKNESQAIYYLKKAIQTDKSYQKRILNDPDLDNIRNSDAFINLTNLKSQHHSRLANPFRNNLAL